MTLKPKILDRYIMKKFIMTFLIALLIIIAIVIIFDISEKIENFVEHEVPIKSIIFDYYINFIPYFINMFSPLFVFITVIFFTSIMASNSEIIAILSGGVSYHSRKQMNATFPLSKKKAEKIHIKSRTTSVLWVVSSGQFLRPLFSLCGKVQND